MPAHSDLSSSDPIAIREWLQFNHPKQLAMIDTFEKDFSLGKLSSPDRRFITSKTVELLKSLIGATRWKTPAELLTLLRGIGRELQAVTGAREPAVTNVVRRIMAAVREELNQETFGKNHNASLETLLYSDESSATNNAAWPPSYHHPKPDLKQCIMEAIQDTMLDLEDLHKNISDQALNHIHAGEVILVYGHSKTVELFLKAAAVKKRSFQVVVSEGAPHFGGHDMAKALAEAGIDTIIISDAMIFAVMARVNKVLLGAHAVLANGGLITQAGSNVVGLAARQNAVPVVCISGMYKLCPMYPHEGQDTLNDLVSPASVMDYSDLLSSKVELINPVHDYVAPELISLYVTNVGVFQPSYIYRLLAENYHSDDWESFE